MSVDYIQNPQNKADFRTLQHDFRTIEHRANILAQLQLADSHIARFKNRLVNFDFSDLQKLLVQLKSSLKLKRLPIAAELERTTKQRSNSSEPAREKHFELYSRIIGERRATLEGFVSRLVQEKQMQGRVVHEAFWRVPSLGHQRDLWKNIEKVTRKV